MDASPIRCVAVFEARTEDSLEHNQALWTANDPFPAAAREFGASRYVRSLSRRTDERAWRPRTRLGAAQFWLDDLDQALKLGEALKKRRLVADNRLLADAHAMVLVTRERPVIPNPNREAVGDNLRALFFIKRKPGMSIADYQAHWLNVHGALVVGTPGIIRYIQCHVAPESYDALAPEYDGMVEMTWSDEAGRAANNASSHAKAQADDLPNLFDLKAGMRFFVEEETLI